MLLIIVSLLFDLSASFSFQSTVLTYNAPPVKNQPDANHLRSHSTELSLSSSNSIINPTFSKAQTMKAALLKDLLYPKYNLNPANSQTQTTINRKINSLIALHPTLINTSKQKLVEAFELLSKQIINLQSLDTIKREVNDGEIDINGNEDIVEEEIRLLVFSCPRILSYKKLDVLDTIKTLVKYLPPPKVKRKAIVLDNGGKEVSFSSSKSIEHLYYYKILRNSISILLLTDNQLIKRIDEISKVLGVAASATNESEAEEEKEMIIQTNKSSKSLTNFILQAPKLLAYNNVGSMISAKIESLVSILYFLSSSLESGENDTTTNKNEQQQLKLIEELTLKSKEMVIKCPSLLYYNIQTTVRNKILCLFLVLLGVMDFDLISPTNDDVGSPVVDDKKLPKLKIFGITDSESWRIIGLPIGDLPVSPPPRDERERLSPVQSFTKSGGSNIKKEIQKQVKSYIFRNIYGTPSILLYSYGVFSRVGYEREVIARKQSLISNKSWKLASNINRNSNNNINKGETVKKVKLLLSGNAKQNNERNIDIVPLLAMSITKLIKQSTEKYIDNNGEGYRNYLVGKVDGLKGDEEGGGNFLETGVLEKVYGGVLRERVCELVD